jgi:hypothetical protein
MSINSFTQSLLSPSWLQGSSSNVGTNSIVSAGLGVQLPSSMTSQDAGLDSALALLGESGSPSMSYNGASAITSGSNSLSSLFNFSPTTSNSFTGTLTNQTLGTPQDSSSSGLSGLLSMVSSYLPGIGASTSTGLPTQPTTNTGSNVAQTMGFGNANLISAPSNEDPATQNAQLQQSLAAIATDPEGSILLNKAKQLGVTIQVGDPAAAAGAKDVTVKGDGLTDNLSVAKDGTIIVNGVTLSDANGNIRVVVRDPSNIKTIAHELVHADSTNDGNSKQEEGIADVIGSRIANNLGGSAVGGLSGSDEQIYLNKQQYYPNLPTTNAIRQTLAGLGLSVDV